MKLGSSNIFLNESFKNFLSDILVRSFDSYEWIIEELEILNLNPTLTLFDLTSKQIKQFYIVYESMIQ